MDWAIAVVKGLANAHPLETQEARITIAAPVIKSYPIVIKSGITTGRNTRFISHTPVNSPCDVIKSITIKDDAAKGSFLSLIQAADIVV